MTTLSFNNIEFTKKDDRLEVCFLKIFKADMPLSSHEVSKHSITVDSESRFMMHLDQALKNLTNTMTGKPAVYIHRNSGIPLVGSGEFGIVDRGTSLLEVKPITSCNLSCIYCSIDQDRRMIDFVVEADYLVDEFRKIADFKDCPLEAHIGTQGEPLLYADILHLIEGLDNIEQVERISMDTNATMLTKRMVDDLVKAGLTQFNVSLNSITKKTADTLAGKPYPVKHVKEMCSYIAKKADLTLAPVYVPGFNDDELGRIVEFGKRLKARVGIQNFLNYRFGRNPVRQLPWPKFYSMLRKLERQHDMKLIFKPEDFNIRPCKQLPKPFKKGDIIKAEIVCPGRLPNESIGVAEGRNITIIGCRSSGSCRVKILRSKHNIFYGKKY
ncbi:MAG: radical SAM protein [Nanoarchaeota archaeon]|nr:radical SAM protein [Nanoarchaeota archaeon]